MKLRFIVPLLLLALAAPLRAQPAKPPGEGASRQQAAGASAPATLTLWNRPIVVFRAPIGQLSVAERAADAEQHLEDLFDQLRPEEIRAVPAAVGDQEGIMILAGGRLLFGILRGDIDPSVGETLESVSQRAVQRLQDVLRDRAEQRRLPALLTGIGLSLVATLLLPLILFALARAADRVLARLAIATHARSISLLRTDLWPFLGVLERGVVRLTAWGLGLVTVYVWLTFVLHLFPYSRPWGEHLRGYLTTLLAELGLRALGAVPGLFTVLLIFLPTRAVTRIVDRLFRAVETGAVVLPVLDPDTAKATRRVATTVLWLFALTVAYPYIPGSGTEAFKAIGVFAGLMLSLGSAGLVNQIMSGLAVVYSRALRAGEVVRAGDIVGQVSEVGVLSTRITTPRTEEITIPNVVLAATTVTNYSRLAGEEGAVVSTTVTIGYDAPWRQVHALLLLAAERTPGTRREPRPQIVQQALSDFYVQYELRAHIEKAEDRFRVLSDLHAHIQDAFNEFGVQIMSPAFESQPETPVVVPKAHWYRTPAASSPDGEREANA